jgi:hypothetical protein
MLTERDKSVSKNDSGGTILARLISSEICYTTVQTCVDLQ